MALKRLDEEFDLRPGTQLLPYMKRLLPSLEGRFQNLESTQSLLAGINDEIRAAALLRMNEILVPATRDILEVTKLGFLLAPIDGSYTLVMGDMTFPITPGVQQDTFTPSPYLIIEHTPDDYAIARLTSYDQDLGILEVTITALHGNHGPFADWIVSSTPGMADSTKLYHDEVGPWRDEVAADTIEVRQKHQEILDVADALTSSGVDLFNYVRKDGTTPFTAAQPGVSPNANANDVMLATTAWTRSRMNEYLMGSMSSSGAVMTGPLVLSGPPTQPNHATTKTYVDNVLGAGGTVNAILTISTSNPSLRLRPLSTNENRMIEALATDGSQRWVMALADNTPITGGNTGANFSLLRYSDAGAFLDTPLTINRQTGATSIKALNYSGVITGTGDATFVGDLTTYRSGGTTGVLWLNQAHTAYLFWDGTKHNITGGPVTVGSNSFTSGPINVGTVTCTSINTQGNTITASNPTFGGTTTINGGITISSGSPQILLNDTDWGPMYLHSNGGLAGFLNNSGSWVQYVNVNGQIWSPYYGWIHDYVYGTANSLANSAAAGAANGKVSNGRMVYGGDPGISTGRPYNGNWVIENWAGSALTGWQMSAQDGYQDTLIGFRIRYMQLYTTGWFTLGYA